MKDKIAGVLIRIRIRKTGLQKEGKAMDLEMLYQQYSKKVYGYLLSLCGQPDLAEDLLQETFLRASQRIDDFHGESSLSTWLCSIGRNLFYDHQRRQKKEYQPEELLLSFVQEERDLRLFRFLHEVKEPYREVLILRTFCLLSFREIGDIFSKSENWARVVFFRAKAELRKVWEEHETE